MSIKQRVGNALLWLAYCVANCTRNPYARARQLHKLNLIAIETEEHRSGS